MCWREKQRGGREGTKGRGLSCFVLFQIVAFRIISGSFSFSFRIVAFRFSASYDGDVDVVVGWVMVLSVTHWGLHRGVWGGIG